ncbi:vif protein [Simian immunodeficiency virus]|uniref:Virion infectivity factor n=1 Tax=Simian immunodeficiency virus TaxID=11723 RepID=A4UDG4_SIV|nr:vif protein [Simian immunodeficiency virus]
MAPRKMWVVSPIQETTERKMDWIIRATKHHIFSGKTPFVYVHHYQVQHQRFSQNKIKLALTQNTLESGETEVTFIEITVLWDVTNVGPASLSKSTYWKQSYILEWVYMRKGPRDRERDYVWYHTYLTPEIAMKIIHTHHFSCFYSQDIPRVIRGQPPLGDCEHPGAHTKVGPPPTLQVLALLTLKKHGKSTTQPQTSMALQSGPNYHAAGPTGHVGPKRRGRKTLFQRRAPWNLE